MICVWIKQALNSCHVCKKHGGSNSVSAMQRQLDLLEDLLGGSKQNCIRHMVLLVVEGQVYHRDPSAQEDTSLLWPMSRPDPSWVGRSALGWLKAFTSFPERSGCFATLKKNLDNTRLFSEIAGIPTPPEFPPFERLRPNLQVLVSLPSVALWLKKIDHISS